VAAAAAFGDELVVDDTRKRVHLAPNRRERAASLGASTLVAAAAAGLAVVGLGHGRPSWLTLGAYVLAYAVALSVEFEIAHGSAVPTELVLVPMLFAVDPYLVPACVTAGLALGGVLDLVRGRVHGERLVALPASAGHAIGPALVLGLLASGPPAARNWPVYVLALGSQFAFDFATTAGRHALALGTSPRALVRPLYWVFVVDTTLAPVGLLAALETGPRPAAPLLLVPLLGLLAALANDRSERIDRSIELGHAYVGASREARTDPLTRVGNRLAWEEALVSAAHDVENGVQHTIVLVDVDDLKGANDSRGHDFGDRLLAAAARAVERAVRPADRLARIGGDEFAVLAAGLDAPASGELAARIRAAIAAEDPIDGVRLQASVGAASLPPARSISELLRAADAALYAEKARRGRPLAVVG